MGAHKVRRLSISPVIMQLIHVIRQFIRHFDLAWEPDEKNRIVMELGGLSFDLNFHRGFSYVQRSAPVLLKMKFE